MSDKKNQERHFLNMVAQATSDFPVGCIRDDEEPDFIIESGSDAIGIEVTRIFHAPCPDERPKQVEESEREQITQLACTFASLIESALMLAWQFIQVCVGGTPADAVFST